jgi:hypothetical protein
LSANGEKIEDLLAERGIMVSYETVRRWVNHFGPKIAADLGKCRPKPQWPWSICGAPSTPRAKCSMWRDQIDAQAFEKICLCRGR